MSQAIANRLGLEPDKPCAASLSFMTRAGLDSLRGNNFLRDTEWSATSSNSMRLAKGVLKSKDRFIILDEPEIVMGEEMQLAFAQYVNSVKKDVLECSLGLLVITHSRIIVKELENDAFVNIDHSSYTKQDWLNRDIIPTDFDQFEKRSDALFEAIRDRETKFKEKEKET
jgi:predicted ATPase